MANALAMRMPQFDVSNTQLDINPLMQAFAGIRQQRQQDVENQRAEQQLGMQRERFGLEKQRMERQFQQELADKAGRLAQAYEMESDPTRKTALGTAMLGVHPEMGANLAKAGINPNDHATVARFLRSQGSSFDPLGEKAKQAQIAASQASTAASQAQAAQISRQTPDWRMANAARFGIDPTTPEGKAFVISGQYSPSGTKVGHAPEGSVFYQTDKNGNTTFLNPPGSDGPGGNKKFDEEASKAFVKRYSENMDQGSQARTQVADLDRLDELSKSIGTQGAAAQIKSSLGPYANALGVKIDGLNEIQAFTAIVAKLAPSMRPPGAGATSDFEFKQYLSSLPQLAQTAEGRALILDQMRTMNNYKVAVGDISEQVLNRKINRVQAEEQIKALGNPLQAWRKQPGAVAPSEPAAQTSRAPIADLISTTRQRIQAGDVDVRAVFDSARRAIEAGGDPVAIRRRVQELTGRTLEQDQPQQPQPRRGSLNREVIRGNP